MAPFDEVAFELGTGRALRPVKTQFGWHVIEAVADVEDAATQELAEVEEQISTTLLEEKRPHQRVGAGAQGSLRRPGRLRARLRAAAGSRDDLRRYRHAPQTE